MRGSIKGLVTLLQKALDRNLLAFHCILHQEALCAQTFPSECVAVMNLVIEMVNKIIAKALNHRQFCELLDEANIPISCYTTKSDGCPGVRFCVALWLV